MVAVTVACLAASLGDLTADYWAALMVEQLVGLMEWMWVEWMVVCSVGTKAVTLVGGLAGNWAEL